MNQAVDHADRQMLRVAEAGTEYRLCLPHLLPEAADPQAMLAAAQRVLAKHSTATQSTAASRARSTAAFMLFCAGQPADAEAILRVVIAAQTAAQDESARTSSELRLVQVLQRLDRVHEAVNLATQVIARQAEDSVARHFALHHLGKALVQAGAYSSGRAVLSEALALRQALGNTELIASTLWALSLVPSANEA